VPVPSQQVLLASLALVTLAAAPVAPPTAPSPAPVVLVRGGGWVGSGVVWDGTAGRVLTALHVVEEMDAITVQLPGEPARRAVVVDREPALDLALLAVEGATADGPPLGASSALAPGERVALAGCPAGACARGEGVVIAPSRPFAGARYVALAASVRPGASGGPVLDARGALVAVVDLALVREGAVALAIPVELAAARFPRSGARAVARAP